MNAAAELHNHSAVLNKIPAGGGDASDSDSDEESDTPGNADNEADEDGKGRCPIVTWT